MQLKPSTFLIVLGIVLLGISPFYPLVTLIVDTSPPTCSNFVPANGAVVPSIKSASVTASDSVSGVSAVYFALYNVDTNTYVVPNTKASLVSGDKYSGTWQISFTEVTQPAKYYQIQWTAIDYADNSISYQIYITIYTELQGKWYINNIEITSTTQTLYSKTTTVSFQFVKTQGVADSYIKCWVEKDSAKLIDLTNTAAGTWTGSYTFTPGTYNLKLVATDGTKTITFSVVEITIPGAIVWTMTTQQAMIIAGIIAIVAGILIRRRET